MKETIKRYNLALPEDMFNRVQAVADFQGTTILEVIKKFIKLGLLVSRDEGRVLIKRGDKEVEIFLL